MERVEFQFTTEFDLEFCYQQFYVYDRTLFPETIDLTPDHLRQGFARLESFVVFRALQQEGTAHATLILSNQGHLPPLENFERIISVPVEIVSGELAIDGPASDGSFIYPIPPGHYNAIVAQKSTDDDTEDISIIMLKANTPLQYSSILLADPKLDPPDKLIEL